MKIELNRNCLTFDLKPCNISETVEKRSTPLADEFHPLALFVC
jgi:hypothetical protein